MKLGPIDMLQHLKSINGIEGIKPPASAPTDKPASSNPTSFSQFLSESLETVNKYGIEADQSIQRSLEGKETNPHNTMIALQKADVTFRLMLSVQQRLIDAYQQIIRTPIG